MNQRDNVNQGEVRRAPRKSVSRAVVVAYGEKRATVGETFVNISSSGARIRTLARQELLDGFFLIDLAEKAAYLCAVLHHSVGVYGVKFVSWHRFRAYRSRSTSSRRSAWILRDASGGVL